MRDQSMGAVKQIAIRPLSLRSTQRRWNSQPVPMVRAYDEKCVAVACQAFGLVFSGLAPTILLGCDLKAPPGGFGAEKASFGATVPLSSSASFATVMRSAALQPNVTAVIQRGDAMAAARGTFTAKRPLWH
jgi:hypothetical protein